MSVRSVNLTYAPTASGKTWLLSTMANWVWRKHGKRTRIYNAAGGRATAQYLVDSGIAEMWEMRGAEHPFEAVAFAARGYWPASMQDPSGKLVPPLLFRHSLLCRKCGHATQPQDTPCVGNASCPKCRAILSQLQHPYPNPANDLTNIGLIIYEGLTWFADMLLDNQSMRIARGEAVMGGNVAIKFQDGEVGIASSTQGGYGIAQRRIKEAVDACRLIPMDGWVWWSALEDKGKTEGTSGNPVYGPQLVGSAATGPAPSWFDLTLSPRCVSKGKSKEYRLYLSTFFLDDAPNIERPCNNRVPPIVAEGLPDYLVVQPKNAYTLGEVVEDIETRIAAAHAIAKGDAGTTKVNP